MKKGIKTLGLGIIIGTVITSGITLASTLVEKDVYINPFKILLNGSNYEPEMPILNYEGRTYVPLRELATLTGSEVDFVDENIIINNDEKGTAGSNIPIKDNYDEAEYQIKVAMQDWLKEAFGDKVFDARIYVEKIYTAEEEQEMEFLKERNLSANEVAFEVKYEIKPAEGVDPIIFTAATGEYDEKTGWVVEKYNVGILRPNDSGEAKYKITDFGTSF